MHILKIAFSIFLLIYIFNVPYTIAVVEFGYVYYSKKVGRKITSFNNIKSAKFCLIKCINNQFCRSINYNEEQEICEIADQNEVEENLEEAEGWINIQKGKRAYRIVNNQKDQCMLPENVDCNINEGTKLVLKERGRCNHISALFEFDIDTGTIIHQCSRKRLCQNEGDEKLLALKSECDKSDEYNFAIRSWHNTIQFGWKCLRQSSNEARLLDCSRNNLQTGMMFEELAPPSSVNVEIFKESQNLDIFALTTQEEYFIDPVEKGYLDSMTSLANIDENYQVIMWTYFSPPVSGTYQFAILGDNEVRLTVADVNDMTTPLLKIFLKSPSHSRFNFQSSNFVKSDGIVMYTSKKYKINAILMEYTIDDYMTIGVKLPGRPNFERMKKEYFHSKL